MQWYRCHQRIVSALALFALGVQLAASFAHVHAGGAHPPGGGLTAFGAAALDRPSIDRPPAGSPDQPGGSRHDCAVCIAIGLLGNALDGAPPAASLPDPVRFAPLSPRGEPGFSVARFHPFRTRAPPAA